MRIFAVLPGALFGLVFAAAGLFIALETAVPTYESWRAMQKWQPAMATLLNVQGFENETRAVYRYSVNGHPYQNDRVYVSSFKDNIGSYHQNMYAKLNRLYRAGEPVAIWYAPGDPGQSVIDRDMRWGFFALMTGFCAVFVLLGLGVCFSSLASLRKRELRSKRPSLFELGREWREHKAQQGSDKGFMAFVSQKEQDRVADKRAVLEAKPLAERDAWLENKDWRDNRIRSDAKSGVIILWLVALFWNAVSTPALFALEDEIRRGNYAVLLILIFPLIGLVLLGQAWRKTLEWRRHGRIELVMDPFPGSIGGHVGGQMVIRGLRDFNARFKTELECVYSYVSGSGDNRSRKENVRWAESGLARTETAAQGIRLSFRFDVPDDLPEADIVQKGEYFFWRLKITSEQEGLPLSRVYNIPVFKTGEHSREVRHDISNRVKQERQRQADLTQTALDAGKLESTALSRVLRYRDDGRRISFYYPMFRHKVLVLIALIFGGGFSFAAYSINSDFSNSTGMDILMLIFSLPFALVGLAAMVIAVYLAFNNLSVELAGKKIRAIRRLLFIPLSKNHVRIDEIDHMSVQSSGSSGQGASKIEHYRIIVNTRGNKKFTIAEGIDGRDLADQFKDFLYKRLNYSF